jgi:hypothetical protein
VLKILPTIIFIALVFSPAATAGKLYKIVDEKGNITFSQFPPSPAEKNDKLMVESTEVKGSAATVITKKGLTSYCGDIELPKIDNRSSRYNSASSYKERWERDLDRKEKYLAKDKARYLENVNRQYKYKYNSNSSFNADYLAKNQNSVDDIKDLRCAITWAEELNDSSVETKNEMNAELERLTANLTSLQLQLDQRCGFEPAYAPAEYENKQLIRDWKKCANTYRSDIRTLERLIRDESNKIKRHY